jgi:CDGSH-type Zn-finger protein
VQPVYDHPIVTEVVPFEYLYKAEEHHQNYYNRNTNGGYCQSIIEPKLKKVKAIFQSNLKLNNENNKIMKKPNIPQKGPYVIKVPAGTYAWCACGESKNQPYCDGSHKKTDLNPIIQIITEEKTVAWCGCKQSGNAPFCDGTHKSL